MTEHLINFIDPFGKEEGIVIDGCPAWLAVGNTISVGNICRKEIKHIHTTISDNQRIIVNVKLY